MDMYLSTSFMKSSGQHSATFVTVFIIFVRKITALPANFMVQQAWKKVPKLSQLFYCLGASVILMPKFNQLKVAQDPLKVCLMFFLASRSLLNQYASHHWLVSLPDHPLTYIIGRVPPKVIHESIRNFCDHCSIIQKIFVWPPKPGSMGAPRQGKGGGDQEIWHRSHGYDLYLCALP